MIIKTITYLLVLLIIVVTIAAIFRAFQFRLEGFDASLKDYKSSSGYQTQLKLVGELQEARFNGRRDFNDMLETTNVPAAEHCLVNFYTLGCRFTGYLGPFNKGYFDSDSSVLAALKMGCRTLVLEIDYYENSCETPYPRLTIRNASNANVAVLNSDVECQNEQQSNIRDVCASIAKYAFSNSVPNPADPLIIVLYLIKVPKNDGSSDYNKVLTTYYSAIAKGLKPLLNNAVTLLSDGTKAYRQFNEAPLLSSPITDYSGRVLFFCNADTSIFRDQTGIPTEVDLDYIVNLRLTYAQKKFGVTLNTSTNGNKVGVLDSVEEYVKTPNNLLAGIQTSTNSTWTLCFGDDPEAPVPQTSTDMIMNKIGVHCMPIQIWSTSYDYMFDKDHFKKYSFLPKPENLRIKINPTSIPGKASPKLDANAGKLRSPT
jgi:hypothetical protein